jgi:hypothetical protein
VNKKADKEKISSSKQEQIRVLSADKALFYFIKVRWDEKKQEMSYKIKIVNKFLNKYPKHTVTL